eukprot:1569321-Lingulodinium_polyedra.AAC.1
MPVAAAHALVQALGLVQVVRPRELAGLDSTRRPEALRHQGRNEVHVLLFHVLRRPAVQRDVVLRIVKERRP